MTKKYSAIDLFCGIGGLSYGLQKAGIIVKAGVDLDTSCKFAYEANVQSPFLGEDICNISGKDILTQFWNEPKEIKILVGCAPCQPFSTHSNKIKGKEDGKKWNLINEFKRLIQEISPEIVSMENVPNLSNKYIFNEFVSFLKEERYYVYFDNVYCPDYGIPQKRRRLVLLASRLGRLELIPKTHSKESYVTVQDAIGELPPVKAGKKLKCDPLHRTTSLSTINLQRIKQSKPNGTWKDWDKTLLLECHKKETGKSYQSVYGRMAWNEPSPTITTQFYNYGTGRFGHPVQDRALTIREAAILQTFPSDYQFYSNEDEIALTKLGTHIGNAVPVRLGEVIGKSILIHLDKHGK
jgi:DNA (cytosine-5)-methyltransferase 1